MAEHTAPRSLIWPNGIILALAVWLFISPWVFPASSAWSWDAWIVAIVIGGFSIATMVQITEWEDWGNLILGAWIFISPWVLGYAASVGAAWDSYIVGVLIAAISVWGIAAAHQIVSASHSHA